MHRTGHVGAALLAWVPIGWVLATVGSAPGLAVAGGATAVALSTVPDADNLAVGIEHRGPTHSLLFALATAAAVGSVGFWIGSVPGLGGAIVTSSAVDLPARFVLAAVLGTAGAVSVLSHLVADLLTPMGIAPFWPITRRRYTLDLVPSRSPALNYASLALGVLLAGLACACFLRGAAPSIG